jgi:hypothetical protein
LLRPFDDEKLESISPACNETGYRDELVLR